MNKFLPQAVVDMRRLAERIVTAAKKALPDKKKDETSSPVRAKTNLALWTSVTFLEEDEQ